MSLLPIAIGAMLPAAANAAGSVATATGRLGTSFLQTLSDLPAGIAAGANALAGEATAADGIGDADSDSHEAVSELESRTSQWCGKLMSWLRSQGIQGPLKLKAELNELDQPQLIAGGDQAEAVAAAIQKSPELMLEFRDLALDVSASNQPLWAPPGGEAAGSFAPSKLTIIGSGEAASSSWGS